MMVSHYLMAQAAGDKGSRPQDGYSLDRESCIEAALANYKSGNLSKRKVAMQYTLPT